MKTKIAVIAAVTLLALTGCTYEEVQTPTGEKKDVRVTDTAGWYVNLPDGRRVICVTLNGGVDCDFEHATVNIGEVK